MQKKHINEDRNNDTDALMHPVDKHPIDNANTDQKPTNELEGVQNIQQNFQNVVEQAAEEVQRSRLPWYRVSKRAFILLGIYVIQLALFGILAWYVHFNPVLGVDVIITKEFQENQTPWLNFLMVAVSYQGNTLWLSIGLILVATVALWLVRLRLEAIMVVAVSLTSSLLNGLLKLIVERPRPTANLVEIFQKAGGQSFPSGHVMAYVAFWGLLFSFGIILFRKRNWWNYVLLIISAIMVVLVGPSRIYLGDHWASDVLGAYLFGGVWLGISLFVYLRLKERGVLAPKGKERNDVMDPAPAEAPNP